MYTAYHQSTLQNCQDANQYIPNLRPCTYTKEQRSPYKVVVGGI